MVNTQREMLIQQLRTLLAIAEQHLRTKIAISLFYESNYIRIREDIAELQAEVDSVNQQIKELENGE